MPSYQGHLIAANPSNPRDNLTNSVILICQHNNRTTYGIQINNPYPDLQLDGIMAGMGIFAETNVPVYHGGNLKTDKIQVIHTTDWMGMSSQRLTDDIAITGDVSILTAIAANEGPEKYKACAGFWAWEPGTLAEQIKGDADIVHRWETTTATVELIFDTNSQDSWAKTIEASARNTIDAWF